MARLRKRGYIESIPAQGKDLYIVLLPTGGKKSHLAETDTKYFLELSLRSHVRNDCAFWFSNFFNIFFILYF